MYHFTFPAVCFGCVSVTLHYTKTPKIDIPDVAYCMPQNRPPRVRTPNSESLTKALLRHQKTRSLLYGVVCVILRLAISIGHWFVTDAHTDTITVDRARMALHDKMGSHAVLYVQTPCRALQSVVMDFATFAKNDVWFVTHFSSALNKKSLVTAFDARCCCSAFFCWIFAVITSKYYYCIWHIRLTYMAICCIWMPDYSMNKVPPPSTKNMLFSRNWDYASTFDFRSCPSTCFLHQSLTK